MRTVKDRVELVKGRQTELEASTLSNLPLILKEPDDDQVHLLINQFRCGNISKIVNQTLLKQQVEIPQIMRLILINYL